MKGDIVLQQGNYIEMVVDEAEGTRMIACFHVRQSNPQHIDIESYRVEYGGGMQTTTSLQDALTTFRVLTEQDQRTKDRMLCFQLAERVRRRLCIHCGSDQNVIRALCVECRQLPRFQQVLEVE